MSFKVVLVREILSMEKFCCLNGGWYNVTNAAHLSGDHSIIVQNASNVIQCLLKRYSSLRSRIRVDHNRHLLEELEYDSEQLSSYLFFSVIEDIDQSWEAVMEDRCHRNPYSHNETIIFPLFSFILMCNSQHSTLRDDDRFHLILLMNHTAFDGCSGYILINDFLTLATSSNLYEISEPINREISPFLSQIVSRPFCLLYPLISFIAKYFMKRKFGEMPNYIIPFQSIPLINNESSNSHARRYRLKFLFSSTSSTLYLNLHKQCHTHNVTLHGPLSGCLLLAIHHCFSAHNHDRLMPFNIDTSIDMRPHLQDSSVTRFTVGFFSYIGQVKFKQPLPLESNQFWSFAHECMELTHKQLGSTGLPLLINLFTDVSANEPLLNEFLQLCPEGRTSHLCLSNIGKYPFSCDYNQGQIKLHGMHVTSNSTLYHMSATIFITCVGDQQLDISLVHEIETDEKAKMFLDYYIRLIEACADESLCKTETTLAELMQIVEQQ